MKKIISLTCVTILISTAIIYSMESVTNWINENIFDWRERNWSPHFQKRLFG